MATAPNPKTAPNSPTEKARRSALAITVRGEEAVFSRGDFGPRDDALVRRETRAALGEPLSIQGAFQQLREGAIGLDSICLLWWLARRKSRVTSESYGDALDAFPTYGDIYDDDAPPDLVKVEEIDGNRTLGDGSPEA